jgi:hypothetical protein
MKIVKHVIRKEMKIIIIVLLVKVVIFMKKEIALLNVSIVRILMITEIMYALVLLILNVKNVQKKV